MADVLCTHSRGCNDSQGDTATSRAEGIPAVSKQAMLALALVWNVSYVEYIVNKLSGL
jgi:hypothetical protein